jgi:iron(III) transport system ATP-binding protein
VIQPDLLLLDEPLSNLDAKLREEMRAELSRLQHQIGITMIYVTHDQIEALSLSSRIVVMNEGNIEQIGPPEDIYERPATPFVARFVGFDNHIKGTLSSRAGGKTVVVIDGRELVSTRALSDSVKALDPGDPVEVFFRPDDTVLHDAVSDGPLPDDPEPANALPAAINFTNYQGYTTGYSLNAGGTAIRAVVPGKPRKDTGRLYVSIAPDKLIVEKG